jgi:hypothetical protein
LLSKEVSGSVEDMSAELAAAEVPLTTTVTDRDGTPIAQLYTQYRRPATAAQILPTMKAAIIAIEDCRFYDEGGVDPPGNSAGGDQQQQRRRRQRAETGAEEVVEPDVVVAVDDSAGGGRFEALVADRVRPPQADSRAASAEAAKTDGKRDSSSASFHSYLSRTADEYPLPVGCYAGASRPERIARRSSGWKPGEADGRPKSQGIRQVRLVDGPACWAERLNRAADMVNGDRVRAGKQWSPVRLWRRGAGRRRCTALCMPSFVPVVTRRSGSRCCSAGLGPGRSAWPVTSGQSPRLSACSRAGWAGTSTRPLRTWR